MRFETAFGYKAANASSLREARTCQASLVPAVPWQLPSCEQADPIPLHLFAGMCVGPNLFGPHFPECIDLRIESRLEATVV